MSAKTEFKAWLKDVEYWVRIKTRNPQWFIEDAYDRFPFGEMFRDDWSPADAADDIINQVSWGADPGYDAWTKDYYRESIVTMEKDTLWEEIHGPK